MKPSLKKYIICDYASADLKTCSVIKEVNQLIKLHFKAIERGYRDYSLFEIPMINKTIVTVDYVGIYQANSDNNMLEFIEETHEPDVIICNSLSWGNSLDDVEALEEKGYKLILYRSFFTQEGGEKKSFYNTISAVAVVRLVEKLIMPKSLNS